MSYWPQPTSGGTLTPAVYSQMKRRVTRVERGVDRGNCRSRLTIMYLCKASTVREMMDWIP